MSRYIDVNEFYDKMYEWVRMHGGIIRNEMQAILEAVPSIDIVRCQDCKYWNYEMSGCKRNPSVVAWRDDDFCSYGERKESE